MPGSIVPSSIRGLIALSALAGLLCSSAVADEMMRGRPLAVRSDITLIAPDRFVVVYRREVAHALTVTVDAAGRPRANLSPVQALVDRTGATRFERQFVSARPQAAGSRFPDLTGHYLVSLAEGSDLERTMADWAAAPGVDHVEPIGIHSIDLTPNDTWWIYGTSTFPYDQWHYWDAYGIDADQAWDLETGDPSAVVVILDTGVKYRHTDLGGNNPPGPADNSTQGNLWVNPFEIPGNLVDDEGNGFVDDVIGWDFVASLIGGTCVGYDVDCGGVENDPNDGEGHGTFLAGIVSAITNNARAGAGAAGGFSDGTTSGAGNGVRTMSLRIGHRARVVLPPPVVTGLVDMSYAAQAMNYVADMKSRGVNIVAVNCSWGSSNTGGISAAADNLLANDVMVITAAGNSNVSTAHFLATKPGVLAVGASDSTGVGAGFSNFGSWVDLAAPGVGIFSTSHDPTDPDTTHMYVSIGDGTSYSAPMVCAAAALLESYSPGLSRTDKADLLVNEAAPFAPANTKVLGTGILNVNNALLALPITGVGPPPATAGPIALSAYPNPMRAGGQVEVSLPAGVSAKLSVLDLHGRRVRDLGTSGGRPVVWDGTDSRGRRVAVGLYFVVADVGTARAAQRLVVIE